MCRDCAWEDGRTPGGEKSNATALVWLCSLPGYKTSASRTNSALKDAEVIHYFKEVDNLPQEDKLALLRVIGGFLRDVKTKQAYAS